MRVLLPSTREPDPDNAGGGIANEDSSDLPTPKRQKTSSSKIHRGGIFLRAIILANGHLNQPISLLPDDLLVAANGGTNHCLANDLMPSVIIGDLDSLEIDQISKLNAAGTKIIRFPSRKDFTDLELALNYVLDLEIDEILILAALGDRLDQTIANILLPAILAPTRVRLIDGNQELFFLKSPDRLEIEGQSGDTISLIPLSGDSDGITTENLEYPLDDESIPFGSTRGISNVLIGERASITLKKGLLLCIITRISNL